MDETRYFKKIYELVLKLQNSRAGLTKREIADFLECSMKTVERKMAELERCFGDAFIETSTYPKMYKIRSDDLSKSIVLSSGDVSIIRQASDLLLKNNRVAEASDLRQVAEKLQTVLTPQNSRDLEALMVAEGNAHRPVPHKRIDMNIVSDLRMAIKNWNAIEIEYKPKKQDTVNTYTLCPFGILYGERNHYLLAKRYDYLETDELHYYIISNIHKLQILENKRFSVPEDFSMERHTQNLFGMYNEEPFDAEWLFLPKAASEAEQFIFHPSQKMQKNPDGSLTVRFRAGGCLEMAWHLYTWCGQVKVIKPKDFWSRVNKLRKNWF
ncbi:MAG: WYL domain-containing protein [Alphaproteobacteria bacterium]|nr:WYL domain-containing protein [Alphaproteobacteria bacterium]